MKIRRAWCAVGRHLPETTRAVINEQGLTAEFDSRGQFTGSAWLDGTPVPRECLAARDADAIGFTPYTALFCPLHLLPPEWLSPVPDCGDILMLDQAGQFVYIDRAEGSAYQLQGEMIIEVIAVDGEAHLVRAARSAEAARFDSRPDPLHPRLVWRAVYPDGTDRTDYAPLRSVP